MAYRDRDTILAAMIAAVSSAWDRSIGSFIHDALKGSAIELETMHREAEATLDQFFLATCDDDNLDLKVADYGLTRVASAKADGTVTVLGAPASVVHVGDLFSADDILFEATAEVTIPSDSPIAATVNATLDTFTTAATLLVDGTKFKVTADVFPTIVGGGALDGTTNYYMISKSGNAFKISLTRGGTAINLQTSGTNVAIVPDASECAVDVAVIAKEAGVDGNVPALAIGGFPVTLTGISAVWNVLEFEGGVDLESDDDLRSRAVAVVQSKRTSGNVDDYVAWALEVSGVGAARCIPLWDGAGTVKVVLLGDDLTPASGDIVTDATAYIETKRPVGADVTVVAAVSVTLDVRSTLSLKAGAVEEQVVAQLEETISAYIKEQAADRNRIGWAAICNLIFDNEWVEDYTVVEIKATGGTQSGTWGTDNIILDDTEAAELGTITLTVS